MKIIGTRESYLLCKLSLPFLNPYIPMDLYHIHQCFDTWYSLFMLDIWIGFWCHHHLPRLRMLVSAIEKNKTHRRNMCSTLYNGNGIEQTSYNLQFAYLQCIFANDLSPKKGGFDVKIRFCVIQIKVSQNLNEIGC